MIEKYLINALLFNIPIISDLKLQCLSITRNLISKMENLNNLPNLQQLDLSWNRITCIENLDKPFKLKILGIYSNYISDIYPLLPIVENKCIVYFTNNLLPIDKCYNNERRVSRHAWRTIR